MIVGITLRGMALGSIPKSRSDYYAWHERLGASRVSAFQRTFKQAGLERCPEAWRLRVFCKRYQERLLVNTT